MNNSDYKCPHCSNIISLEDPQNSRDDWGSVFPQLCPLCKQPIKLILEESFTIEKDE